MANVKIARLLFRAGGLFELRFARNLLPTVAATVESVAPATGFDPASLASGAPVARFSVAVPAGFAGGWMLLLALATRFAARSAIQLPLTVVPGVAVPLEVPHALRRRGDLADGRYHRSGPAREAK